MISPSAFLTILLQTHEWAQYNLQAIACMRSPSLYTDCTQVDLGYGIPDTNSNAIVLSAENYDNMYYYAYTRVQFNGFQQANFTALQPYWLNATKISVLGSCASNATCMNILEGFSSTAANLILDGYLLAAFHDISAELPNSGHQTWNPTTEYANAMSVWTTMSSFGDDLFGLHNGLGLSVQQNANITEAQLEGANNLAIYLSGGASMIETVLKVIAFRYYDYNDGGALAGYKPVLASSTTSTSSTTYRSMSAMTSTVHSWLSSSVSSSIGSSSVLGLATKTLSTKYSIASSTSSGTASSRRSSTIKSTSSSSIQPKTSKATSSTMKSASSSSTQQKTSKATSSTIKSASSNSMQRKTSKATSSNIKSARSSSVQRKTSKAISSTGMSKSTAIAKSTSKSTHIPSSTIRTVAARSIDAEQHKQPAAVNRKVDRLLEIAHLRGPHRQALKSLQMENYHDLFMTTFPSDPIIAPGNSISLASTTAVFNNLPSTPQKRHCEASSSIADMETSLEAIDQTCTVLGIKSSTLDLASAIKVTALATEVDIMKSFGTAWLDGVSVEISAVSLLCELGLPCFPASTIWSLGNVNTGLSVLGTAIEVASGAEEGEIALNIACLAVGQAIEAYKSAQTCCAKNCASPACVAAGMASNFPGMAC